MIKAARSSLRSGAMAKGWWRRALLRNWTALLRDLRPFPFPWSPSRHNLHLARIPGFPRHIGSIRVRCCFWSEIHLCATPAPLNLCAPTSNRAPASASSYILSSNLNISRDQRITLRNRFDSRWIRKSDSKITRFQFSNIRETEIRSRGEAVGLIGFRRCSSLLWTISLPTVVVYWKIYCRYLQRKVLA